VRAPRRFFALFLVKNLSKRKEEKVFFVRIIILRKTTRTDVWLLCI